MFDQPRWTWLALVPIAAGLLWLWFSQALGLVGFVFPLVPGCLLLASGFSTLLWPGDVRIPQFTAIGGVIGMLMALPAPFITGPGTALALLVFSAAAFVAAGAISVQQEPHVGEVPVPQPSLRLAAKVAVDDALLSTMQVTIPLPGGLDRDRIRAEVLDAREMFEANGWLEKPAGYHVAPPPLEQVQLRSAKSGRTFYEHLRFDSGYEPHPDEPGRERWLSYAPNRTAGAWVLRHAEGDRPWLVCIHGYQMGTPWIDLRAFEPERLHRRFGLNLILPTLPLHGLRKIGRRSGDGFLSGDFLDSIHAEAQAMWDVRRILSWVRAQGEGPVGVYGLSLGGYNTALLAGLDAELSCAIAGIPATDFARLSWRHGPPLQIRQTERRGLQRDVVRTILRVVSPLELPPRVPRERRYLFGGVADRLVPPDQVRDLWRHWERPRIAWYQGSHMSLRWEPAVRRLVEDALRESLLTR